jgi:hypothetical protein
MRKFLAAATTALTLSVIGLSAPAFADHNTTPAPTQGYGGNGPQYGQPYDDSDNGRGNYGQGERGRRSYDFDQNDERGFDGWERGWQRESGYGYQRSTAPQADPPARAPGLLRCARPAAEPLGLWSARLRVHRPGPTCDAARQPL